jgi:phage regulator Rha-like protein
MLAGAGARFFGKRHDNVLDAVERLLAQEPKLGDLNFKATTYLDESNRQSRCADGAVVAYP